MFYFFENKQFVYKVSMKQLHDTNHNLFIY